MVMLISVLFYLGLSVLWIYAEPIIVLKREIGFKEENYETFPKWKRWVHKLINCLFCSSLWITLILSLDPQLAVITSLFAYIMENKF